MNDSTNELVPEIDVLIATARWLHLAGWHVESVSIPKRQSLGLADQMKKLLLTILKEYPDFDVPSFKDSGPDIVAKKDGETWRIECKGLGKGGPQTLRNNFDRALASTVSYYDSSINLRIGLAIPNESSYKGLVRSRIPQALREAVHLWIFLYSRKESKIRPIEPLTDVA